MAVEDKVPCNQSLSEDMDKKTTCSALNCSNPRRNNGKQRYCLEHHNAWCRENRKPKADITPFEAMKAKARSIANNARRDGKLIPEPCKCGCEKVEMHHPDYSKPLEIIWLCRDCHLELHRKEREIEKEQEEFRNMGHG